MAYIAVAVAAIIPPIGVTDQGWGHRLGFRCGAHLRSSVRAIAPAGDTAMEPGASPLASIAIEPNRMEGSPHFTGFTRGERRLSG